MSDIKTGHFYVQHPPLLNITWYHRSNKIGMNRFRVLTWTGPPHGYFPQGTDLLMTNKRKDSERKWREDKLVVPGRNRSPMKRMAVNIIIDSTTHQDNIS